MKDEGEQERQVMSVGVSDTTREPRDIGERTLEYGVRAVRLYRALSESKDGAAWVVAKQFLRSATSVGANVAEAKSAESQADFIHKYGIALKEVRESHYWLQLMEKAEIIPNSRLADLKQETHELTAILTAIILKRKRSQASESEKK